VTERKPAEAAQRAVAGLGFALELPQGWEARILIGAGGRPVLHAASFPLPSNDDDHGEIARETIGRGEMYLNVRDLGPGGTGVPLPVAFRPSDFGLPPPGPGSRCYFITVARREIAAFGHVFRLTVTSGSDEQPSGIAVGKVNALLSTLSLKPSTTDPSPPARVGAQLAGYGIEPHLPSGWDGRVLPGVVEAPNFRLPATADTSGPLSLGRGDLVLLAATARDGAHGGKRGAGDAPHRTGRLLPGPGKAAVKVTATFRKRHSQRNRGSLSRRSRAYKNRFERKSTV
jgi:hypothetical protein